MLLLWCQYRPARQKTCEVCGDSFQWFFFRFSQNLIFWILDWFDASRQKVSKSVGSLLDMKHQWWTHGPASSKCLDLHFEYLRSSSRISFFVADSPNDLLAYMWCIYAQWCYYNKLWNKKGNLEWQVANFRAANIAFLCFSKSILAASTFFCTYPARWLVSI